MFNSVRVGGLTEEIIDTLKGRVIDIHIAGKFQEMQSLDMPPVCLFPTRKHCDGVNEQMVSLLDSDVHVIACTDKVDERRTTTKWQEKAAKQLEKLNKDCSNTAGLEAIFKVAVGARDMLRRNIALKQGLVNRAIGTVLTVLPGRISIKFDNLEDPCDIKE